jgi:polysaccharide export outer membrane protein
MKSFRIILVFLAVLVFTSCKLLNPSKMLRTKNYPYSSTSKDTVIHEYKIAPNDKLIFRLYTNEGEKLINPLENNLNNQNMVNTITYLVEFDGNVKLPILGREKLSGLTLREAEKKLENAYSKFYNKPFVQLEVTNNRVIVFPGGDGGNSTVITLTNANTTLIEALALAGGITDGKAHRIKLIRGDPKNPEVYLIDFSTISGMKQSNLVLQANDIIYVEPRPKVAQRILENLTPYLALISATLLIYSLFK